MQTKLSKLIEAAQANDWRKAISIASKFPQLGDHKTEITRAQMAYTNPGFCRQIGRDPDACIEAGRLALIARYSIKH